MVPVMQIKRPAILVGSSISASTVIDFALHHPEATAKLVLMGPAAWNEGLGLFPLLPRWAAILGTQVLSSIFDSGPVQTVVALITVCINAGTLHTSFSRARLALHDLTCHCGTCACTAQRDTPGKPI